MDVLRPALDKSVVRTGKELLKQGRQVMREGQQQYLSPKARIKELKAASTNGGRTIESADGDSFNSLRGKSDRSGAKAHLKSEHYDNGKPGPAHSDAPFVDRDDM